MDSTRRGRYIVRERRDRSMQQTEKSPEEIRRRLREIERNRNRSAVLLFCLLPAMAVIQVLDAPAFWSYLVCGAVIIVAFWGGILQNRCPNCGRFYWPFGKTRFQDVRYCPHCGLDLRTGKLDPTQKP